MPTRHQPTLGILLILAAGLLLASAGIFALQLFLIATQATSPLGFARAFYVLMFCHFGVALVVSSLSNERAEVRLQKVAQTPAGQVCLLVVCPRAARVCQ